MKGHNEITLHDINLLSMAKSLWKCAKISDHEGIQELKKELVLDHSWFGMDGVFAQLQTNLKTHKPLGQVKPGAIHSATKNPLVPLSKYVAWKLRKVFSRERHILNSVEKFHSRIEELELDQEDRLITADVKDFFVVGDTWYLARRAASILEPQDRNLTERVILFFAPKPVCVLYICVNPGKFFRLNGIRHGICCKWLN